MKHMEQEQQMKLGMSWNRLDRVHSYSSSCKGFSPKEYPAYEIFMHQNNTNSYYRDKFCEQTTNWMQF